MFLYVLTKFFKEQSLSSSVRILPCACCKGYQTMQILPKKHISLFWTGVIPIVEEQVLLTFPRTVPAVYFLTHWKIFITAGTPCIPTNTFQLCWLAAFIHIKIKYTETPRMLKECTFYKMYILRWKRNRGFLFPDTLAS